tara:strand:- start:273 stop:1661 length:1389 start_codon:yes stop_codon:yes gene_type:complete
MTAKKKTFVSPFSINWKFDNRQFLKNHPECGTVLFNIWDRVHEKRSLIGVSIHCTAEVFEAITGNFTTVNKEIRSEKKWANRKEPLDLREKSKILKENKALAEKINGAMRKAQDLNSFKYCRTIKQFKKLLNESTSYYVFEMFDKAILEKEKLKKWKTAKGYTTVKNSLQEYSIVGKLNKSQEEFLIRMKTSDISDISFAEIDVDYLNHYEGYLKKKGLQKNGIAGYMRIIRTVYNLAISLNVTKKSFYPFGKGRYQIKTEIKTKSVLNSEDWIKLMKFKTPYPARTKALDMFKLSYALNGANCYDMCTILKTDLTKEHIEFYRKKSDRKNNNIKRVVYRTDFIDFMITKYGSDIDSPYLLDLLGKEYQLETKETRKQCEAINRGWDKQLKKIANAIDIPKISPMWARHQRATNLIDKGATKEEVNTMWGHDSMKTTETYIHSFPSAQKIKDKAENLDKELM